MRARGKTQETKWRKEKEGREEERRRTTRKGGVVVVAAAAEAPEATESTGTFEYQAEVSRLMDLIVNSLYSNKDVFLRELISNASDALDKARFMSIGGTDIGDVNELSVKIKCDEDAKTLTIEDNGIGMTRTDLNDSLGTIAKSGTAKFMEAMQQKGDVENLIGKFGVGFYSSFLVSDRVRVQTKNHGDADAWVWESSVGSSQYTIEKDESDDAPSRGTKVTLFLKEDSAEMADSEKVGELIKTYSEFIQFPIKLWSSEQKARKVQDVEATDKLIEQKKQEREEKIAKGEDPGPEEAVTPITKTEYDTVWDWQTQNENKPIWTRSPKEVTDEEYNEFFKSAFKEFLDPSAHTHFGVEGDIEFKALLFIPGMAPFEQQDLMKKSKAIKLFVKRVFISDEFDGDLLPRYLHFIKGIVDSSDLPLNVSREILQESRVVRIMKRRLVRKSLDMIRQMSEKTDDEGVKAYKEFWTNFGRNVKLGIIEDSGNRDELAKLVRYSSSTSGDELVSLPQYVENMKEGQKDIYYIAADSKEVADRAPFLEQLKQKGLEVLYLTDAIDEVCMTNLQKFDDYSIVDVSKEEISLGEDSEEEKKKDEEVTESFKKVTDYMKGILGEDVEKVVVSKRISDTPAIVVTSKFGWSANMERIMKSQAMGDTRSMEYMKGRKILEISPTSPVILDIKSKVDAGDQSSAVEDSVKLLFETSMITSGFELPDATTYAARVYRAMGFNIEVKEPSPAAASASADASSSSSVDPEIISPSDSDDPWKN